MEDDAVMGEGDLEDEVKIKDDGKEEEKAENWEGANGDGELEEENEKTGKNGDNVIQPEIQQEQNDNEEQKKEEEERDRKCKRGNGEDGKKVDEFGLEEEKDG